MTMTYVKYAYPLHKAFPSVPEEAGETSNPFDITFIDFENDGYVERVNSYDGQVDKVFHTMDAWLDYLTYLSNNPYRDIEADEMRECAKEASAHEPHLTFVDENDKIVNEFSENYDEKGNGSHYQGFFGIDITPKGASEQMILELQWLETQQHMSPYREHPEWFKAAVLMQVRKYQDRLGKKDKDLQELTKSSWYLRFLTAFEKNEMKPIRVKDIDDILAR